MKLKILISGIFVFVTSTLNAQLFSSAAGKSLPAGLSIGNHLEYGYDVNLDNQILENWLQMDYRSGIFQTGIRFEIFEPNDPDPAISRGKTRYADIPFKYVSAQIGKRRSGVKITVGNYYSFFGRGMILKSYEDRALRVDNNLLGVKFDGRINNFLFTALSGMAENSKAERKDILHAIDLQYYLGRSKIGASFALNIPNSDIAPTSLSSLRLESSVWNFDIYSEYGVKMNEDIRNKIFNNKERFVGNAFYGSINFYYDNFSASGEYKYYDNFMFTSEDATIIYNNPPALRKEHTFILLNRHPSALDQNNEKGFQIEANYEINSSNSLLVNYSNTKSLPKSSLYKRVLNFNTSEETVFNEFYFSFEREWNENFYTLFGFAMSEENSSNTKNLTPVLETKYYFNDVNTIKMVIEHQQSENQLNFEKYFDDVLTLEFQSSPEYSISLVGEVRTSEPVLNELQHDYWGFVQFSYLLSNNTDISILAGSRQAGNICIGGVCRYEPEFKGVELKLLTRLY